MNLHIICIGSIKESFYKEAVAEYIKRLSGYCKCEIIELKDEKTPNNNQDNSILKVKEIEGDRILSKFPHTIVIIVEHHYHSDYVSMVYKIKDLHLVKELI